MWDSITALINEIKRCEKAGATLSAIVMSYVCIDTMTFLSLPSGRESQGRADFIAWVDTYMTGHDSQPYQYRGIDVYGARCSVLHAFGANANFHQQNPDAKKYGYHDGGEHIYVPDENDNLVIIGTASYLNDVVHAVDVFMMECKGNVELQKRVVARLPKVFAALPLA